MQRILVLLLILLCLVGGAVTYVYWPSLQQRYETIAIHHEQEKADLQKTRELLNRDEPEEAMEIIQLYAANIDDQTETGREWLDLLIRASETTSNHPQLLLLHEYYPKAFDSHEKAALLIANQYILAHHIGKYQTVRDNWKGREVRPEAWFVLDSDGLLLEGKRKEAVDFLKSRSFPGKNDSARLVRLALLYVYEQPKVAWDYLTQAYHKDPENPDIRSYRAKLLETVGKEQLALSEYVAAVQVDSKNPYLKDQLAEFYVRTKQYPEALKIWTEQLKNNPQDSIWLKSLFWSKVAIPNGFDLYSIAPPEGKLYPLIEYLLSLKPATFWSTSSFESLPEGQHYLKTQQATFWLRLIEDLKLGKNQEAYELLLYNPFSTVSWNRQLEENLEKILFYRSRGHFPSNSEKVASQASAGTAPSFFDQIDALTSSKSAVPDDLHALLTGPEAFAMAFLNAGWLEAGLALHTLSIIPVNYPDWVAVEIAKAMRQRQGDKAALDFAIGQLPSSALTLFISELLIARGNSEAALEKLNRLKAENSDVGYRAAWLASLIHIESGQYEDAKVAIHAQPSLKESVQGREALARISLLEGDSQTADLMYASMENISPEAQSYLARKAFLEKDWNRARDLTEKLLHRYPNNTLLRENLNKIIEEQKKAY